MNKVASKTMEIKVIAIGDPIGKTSLLRTFAESKFPTNTLTQPIFDNYNKNITISSEEYSIFLMDTPGYDFYYRLQNSVYKHVNSSKNTCCLMCYSVVDKKSYKSVRKIWFPDIKRACPNVPIVLVGTQIDLRDELSTDVIRREQGIKLMSKINAESYVECSAKSGTNVVQVFEEAVLCTLKGKTCHKTKCILQ